MDNHKSELIRWTWKLLFVNAAIWPAFGIFSLMRMDLNQSVPRYVLMIIAGLMFGNVGALLLAGWGLQQGSRWGFWFALAILVVNIVLTFTDQFGAFDFATLVLDLIILGLLIYARKELRTAYN